MPDPRSVPLGWLPGGLLRVEIWLNNGLCFLLVDSGATHLTLLPEVVTALRLHPLPRSAAASVLGLPNQAATLYTLPEAEVAGIFRYDLDVAEIDIDWVRTLGLHGLVGMNWFRSFPHVCLVALDTANPTLEVHLDP